MARRGSALTRGSDLYSKLRDAILVGRLAPGERLKPAILSDRYDVSISVVREALTRLAEQRLVLAQPNQGFSVAELTVGHLSDLVEARCLIEGMTIRLSVERGDLDWESRVIATHHRLERTPIWIEPELEINPEWVAFHTEFHATLVEACRNEVLRETCASLADMAELYRRWHQSGGSSSQRDVVEEHRELATAALDHDADRASRLLADHIRRTGEMAVEGIPVLAKELSKRNSAT